ncbi:MAG: hypothetical protein NEA02_16100 [Thermoanaerobaculia bacterium]|nr:hypothetical protein [Thermoanaerobaculia bacterium]
MSENSRRVLELLASGKVTVEEAERLLRAVEAVPAGAREEAPGNAEKAPARYLRIAVQKAANGCGPEKQVNIRVPLSLVKGGMRLGAMIPGYGDAIGEHLRRHGLDLDLSKVSAENLESVLKDMGELAVDVDQGKAQVRITCE